MSKPSCALRGLYGFELMNWGLLLLIDVLTIPSQLSLMSDEIELMPLWIGLSVLTCIGGMGLSLTGLIRGKGLSSFLDGAFYVIALLAGFAARGMVWMLAIVWVTTVNGMQSV